MTKEKSPASGEARLSDLVLLDKKGITKLLSQYEENCQQPEDIKPFIDRYFEQMRRLNLGMK